MGRLENLLWSITPVVQTLEPDTNSRKVSAPSEVKDDEDAVFFTAVERSCKMLHIGSLDPSNCCFERGSTVEKANVSDPPSQATTVPTRVCDEMTFASSYAFVGFWTSERSRTQIPSA
mmetsp:Transcript_14111/g.13642  ORF Transcript_14111/g.13642 Transcript_14111/m.13642 type:complete len:118 (-) Transcript_14111:405-758(-)